MMNLYDWITIDLGGCRAVVVSGNSDVNACTYVRMMNVTIV
jgi:hypothetical protein